MSQGTKKAALLLVALGPEQAAEVIRYLPEQYTEKIMEEVSQIKGLKQDEQEKILEDFFYDLSQNEFQSQGGERFAEDILTKAFGPDKASAILQKFAEQDQSHLIRRLEETDTSILSTLLQEEHPQIVTFIMASLTPGKSAKLMQSLPVNMRAEVAKRVAKMDKMAPEALKNFLRKFTGKIEQEEKNHHTQQAGGLESLVQILSHGDSQMEKHLLDEFDKDDPEFAQDLRNRLVTFEILLDLSNHEIRLIMDRIPEDRTLVLALKGADEAIKRHILSNVSRNRARNIHDELSLTGPLPLSDIENARQKVLQIAKRLDNEGYIILRKSQDEWIE